MSLTPSCLSLPARTCVDDETAQQLALQVTELKQRFDQQLTSIQQQLSSIEECERLIVVSTSVQASVGRSRESELRRYEDKIHMLEQTLANAQKEYAVAMDESREQREKATALRQDVTSRVVALSSAFAHVSSHPSQLDAIGWVQVLEAERKTSEDHSNNPTGTAPVKKHSGFGDSSMMFSRAFTDTYLSEHQGDGDEHATSNCDPGSSVATSATPPATPPAEMSSRGPRGLMARYASSAQRAIRPSLDEKRPGAAGRSVTGGSSAV